MFTKEFNVPIPNTYKRKFKSIKWFKYIITDGNYGKFAYIFDLNIKLTILYVDGGLVIIWCSKVNKTCMQNQQVF